MADLQASRTASSHLVDVVKTGKPDGAGLLVWTALTGMRGAVMIAADRTGKR